MKALSIHQPWAACVVYGRKTVEVRSWQTHYRGDLLICSTARKFFWENDVYPSGYALGIVNVADCVPLTRAHLADAMIEDTDIDNDEIKNSFAWILTNSRFIKPIAVKGKQGLWTYPHDDLIEVIQTAPVGYDARQAFYTSPENEKIISLWDKLA